MPRLRSRTVLLLLSTCSILLILLDSRSQAGEGVRSWGAVVIAPIQRALAAVVDPIVLTVSGADRYLDEDLRDAGARAQRDELAAQVRDAAGGLTGERAQLERGVLAFGGVGVGVGVGGQAAKGAKYRWVAARTVAYSSSGAQQSHISIDAGSRQGVRAGQAVVNAEGLVGRVVEAYDDSATVQLVSDDSSVVGIRLTRSASLAPSAPRQEPSDKEAGVAEGTGQLGRLEVRLLDPFAEVVPGDRVSTLGSANSAYPADVPLGVVESVIGQPGTTSRVVLVRPAARLSALDLVGVLVSAPERRAPRETPANPTPAPAPAPVEAPAIRQVAP